MSRTGRALLLAGIAACAAPPSGRAVPVAPRERTSDILHYDINVDIDHEAGFVEGTVDVRFQPLGEGPVTSLLLDAAEMDIRDVSGADGEELAYRYRDPLLEVQLARPLAGGETRTVHVRYRCFPRRGLYFVPPSATRPDGAWHVWTQGEAEETRHWVPVWDRPDDRATHTLTVTLADGFRVLAAGHRIRSSTGRSGRHTETWEMDAPHVSYLITLVAGELAQGELDSAGEVALPVLAEPADLAQALANFSQTGDILAYFGQLTGQPYPYSKYSQTCVREFIAGGMENITATTLWYGAIHDPADEPQTDPTDLLAHEAAHTWFGNLITCRDWSHLWLNEGFASYYEARYLGHRHGQDRFRQLLLENQRAYVRAELKQGRPIVWNGYDHPDHIFTDHVYQGGASRLHLLRAQLGADVFDEAVRHYVRTHANGVVTSEDLRIALTQSGGVDLERFFEEWIYGAGFPRFQVRLSVAPDAAGWRQPARWLSMEQTQRGRDVFHLPVTVAWSRGGSEHRAVVDVDERLEYVELTGEGELDWVRFDADTTVPMLLDFEQTEAKWRNQLRAASDGVTRLLAAEWFSDHPAGLAADSVAALIEAVERDPFVDVRVTAIEALSAVGDDRVPRLLVDALASPGPRVREAAARALGRQGSDDVLSQLTNAVDDPNGSVAVAALTALVDRGYPGAFTMLVQRARAATGVRWPVAQRLVELAGEMDDDRVLPFLMAQANRHPASRVRAAAVEALGGHLDGPYSIAVFDALGRHLDAPSPTVRTSAARALGKSGAAGAPLQLRARLAMETNADVLDAIEEALGRW